jgi:uncharacterized protein YjbJ (UPF0337 family)
MVRCRRQGLWHGPCDVCHLPALAGIIRREEPFMDSDRIEGPLKEAGGKVKEEWGDLTDDAQTEAEGQAQQVEGDLQNEWGEAKDEARDAVDPNR